MKYLIVGLGNIGAEYENTRHNIGFKILDTLAGVSNISFESNRYASVSNLKYKGRQLILVKPSTYMNLSGKAIAYWLQQEKIPLENLLVLVDDLALPLGTLRVRPSGSDAGHNGLRNIQEIFGHNNYSRLRFGIGNNFPKGHQIDFVLGKWSSEEENLLPKRIELSHEIIYSFVTMGIEKTMNLYNNK